VQTRFLKALKDILPRGCQAIIVTDAGFQGPFFRQVRKLGWHFLGRIRGGANPGSSVKIEPGVLPA
jgi:hypothetical protein